MSRSVKTCRIYARARRDKFSFQEITTRSPIKGDPKNAHLVHFCERAFLHLFERDDLLRLLVPREVHFAVPALADLGHDMELLQAEFGPPFPERGPFALGVGGPFGGELVRGEVPRRGGLLEGCEAGFARREVGQEVKVVVVEVCSGGANRFEALCQSELVRIPIPTPTDRVVRRRLCV